MGSVTLVIGQRNGFTSLTELALCGKYLVFDLYKCIRMAITIFKKFIRGDISSDIRSEIRFYGDA